ncbi:hypothetical protein [Methylocapsa sp. S129]|uniref:hypothetical protein n=1 Tax=Methylocapsa sp. S129 TaxID=1641869 RepID=UPI00131E80E0|nr:hypothetical protein [Methylocapsa sp. S129]
MFVGKSAIIILVAAAMAAPSIADAGSTSGQCGALRAEDAKVRADNEIIQEEGRRRGHPRWCAYARDIIRAADKVIFIITHDPAKCQVTSDRLEAIEAGRTQMVAFTEGCP